MHGHSVSGRVGHKDTVSSSLPQALPENVTSQVPPAKTLRCPTSNSPKRPYRRCGLPASWRSVNQALCLTPPRAFLLRNPEDPDLPLGLAMHGSPGQESAADGEPACTAPRRAARDQSARLAGYLSHPAIERDLAHLRRSRHVLHMHDRPAHPSQGARSTVCRPAQREVPHGATRGQQAITSDRRLFFSLWES